MSRFLNKVQFALGSPLTLGITEIILGYVLTKFSVLVLRGLRQDLVVLAKKDATDLSSNNSHHPTS